MRSNRYHSTMCLLCLHLHSHRMWHRADVGYHTLVSARLLRLRLWRIFCDLMARSGCRCCWRCDDWSHMSGSFLDLDRLLGRICDISTTESLGMLSSRMNSGGMLAVSVVAALRTERLTSLCVVDCSLHCDCVCSHIPLMSTTTLSDQILPL